MATRAVLLSRTGNVHRVIVQGDGADGTGCGMKFAKGRYVYVRPVQALVYHLGECQTPGCWTVNGSWRRFLEGHR